MSDNFKAIRKIEDRYGTVLFRMALTHMACVGSQNLTEKNVEEAINQIKATGNNGFSVMTVDFQIQIIRCAYELSKCGVWDLFCYVKKYLDISEK